MTRVVWTGPARDTCARSAPTSPRTPTATRTWSSSASSLPSADSASTRSRGRVVPELGRPTIREVIEGAYRIVYRVTPDAVQILAVVHGARRFPPVERGPSE